MALRFRCTLALLILAFVDGAPKAKSKTPLAGSQKCPKGHFGSLSKDATVPLCDDHYPDKNAKSGWAILFYKEASASVSAVANRVAMDLGNEPPEKSKNLKMKPKKQRTRIKDLAEKYEFEANIPKKGLEEKGKEALLKLGAVCCDCDGKEQKVCEGQEMGYRIVMPGKPDRVMPEGEIGAQSAEKVMLLIMDTLGFVKGSASAADAEADSKKAKKPKDDEEAHEGAEDLLKKLVKLEEEKKQAIADEDFGAAAKIKKDIAASQEKLDKLKAAAAGLKEQIEELSAKKAKATEEEDYKLASTLKKEIATLQDRLKKTEL